MVSIGTFEVTMQIFSNKLNDMLKTLPARVWNESTRRSVSHSRTQSKRIDADAFFPLSTPR